MKKLLIIFALLLAYPVYGQVRVLIPSQGGTGIGSATAGDVGDCLTVQDDSPFTYSLGTCGLAGSSFDFPFDPLYSGTINATSTVLLFNNGFISSASSSVAGDLFVAGGTSLLGGLTLTCTSCITDTNVADLALGGDVSGTLSASIVANDSHDHTGTTLSGIDVSDDLNLTGGLGLTLTGDDMACDTASGSVFGCLASADWTTFNGKADLGSAMTGTYDGNNFAGGAIGAGDLLYGASAGSITELSIGTRGTILGVTTGGIPGWVSTSTLAWENDSATSTFLSGISVGGGGLKTTAGLTISGGTLLNEDTSTSTFTGGIFANTFRTNLPSCDTLDTDTTGAIICGADASGGSSNPDLIYRSLSSTKYYTASSSATNNLAWHFNNGFVSSGASSTISDNLFLNGEVFASSTVNVMATTTLEKMLFARKIYGGTTTVSNLNLSASDRPFDGANTGRIELHERVVFDDAFTAPTTFIGDWITFSPTVTAPSAINIFSAFNNSATWRFGSAQTLSSMPTFKANPILQHTVNGADSNAVFSGFSGRPSVRPDFASGAINEVTVQGFLAGPRMGRENAGEARGTAIGYGTFTDSFILTFFGQYDFYGSADVKTLAHFHISNPTTNGANTTISNHYGLFIPNLTTGATSTAGIYSDVNVGTSKLFINHAGTASSTHAGAFSVGTTTANYGLTVQGRIVTGGVTPTLNSCGTTPSVRGNNTGGIITVGGTAGNVCHLTFNGRYAKTPSCTLNDAAEATSRISAASTTGFQITGTTISANVINYICVGVE